MVFQLIDINQIRSNGHHERCFNSACMNTKTKLMMAKQFRHEFMLSEFIPTRVENKQPSFPSNFATDDVHQAHIPTVRIEQEQLGYPRMRGGLCKLLTHPNGQLGI